MISRPRRKPCVTPRTMFASSARVRPCSARSFLLSVGRSTVTTLPSTTIFISDTNVYDDSPFGPFTRTVEPFTSTVTPEGIGIGFFPIRDISCDLLSPHQRHDFAANLPGACFLVRHDALRRRDDRDAQTATHARQLLCARIAAQTGTRDALHVADHRLVLEILQVQPEHA